jgi:hypothetical protein
VCCLVTLLLLLGPRLAILVWWLTDAARFAVAFQGWPHPSQLTLPLWVWPLAGGIFLPWTTLAYVFVSPGGVVGPAWLLIGVGLLIDLGSHLGGGYRNRNRLPRYSN